MALIKYNQPLQAAIDEVSTGDLIVDLGGESRWVKGRINWRPGVQTINGTIKFEDGAHLVHCEGSGMQHITIESRQGNYDRPIIELVNAKDNLFDTITVNGNNPRTVFGCRTKAINVKANHIFINGTLGYGWLYDDATTERDNPLYRVFDGQDYAGEPIGYGLDVRDYHYGSAPLITAADGFEINTPLLGFGGIYIEDINIYQAILGTNKGIGAGFANCTDVHIKKARVSNAARSGIHFEKGGNHLIEDFEVIGGGRGISIGHTDGTTFQNGKLQDNKQWITSYNTLSGDIYGPAKNLNLEDVSLVGATQDGVLIANVDGYRLYNIDVSDYKGSPKSIFKFYQEDTEGVRQGVTNSSIEKVTFHRGENGITPESLIDISNSPGNKVSNIFSPDLPRIVRVDGNEIHF